MEKIRVNFNLGPIDKSENIIGFFEYEVKNTEDKVQIINVVKSSFKRLGIAKNAIIIGFIEIFKANNKIYDIDIFRAGNIHKNYLTKV